jgi:hypothetical protein
MSQDVLKIVIQAADTASSACFPHDEVKHWPAGALEDLISAGLLQEMPHATSVECDGCEEACFKEVEFIEGGEGEDPRAYITCDERDDIGRVPVPLDRLRRWELSLSNLTRSLSEAMPTSGEQEEIIPQRIWQLGKATLAGQLREVFYIHGSTWPDFESLLRGTPRFCQVRRPIVLVTCNLPNKQVWGDENTSVFALYGLLQLEDNGLTLDRIAIEEALGGQRRPKAAAALRPIHCPQDAQWKDVLIIMKEHSFGYKIFDKHGKRSFQQAGFENRTKRKYSDQFWGLLQQFAYGGGTLREEILDQDTRNNLKQYVSEVRRRLKAVFQLDGDPIKKKKGESYTTIFKITSKEGITITVPADTKWSDITIMEGRNGKLRFTIPAKERFLAYSDGRSAERGKEMAEQPGAVTHEYDLLTLGLLDDKEKPSQIGEALLAVLRSEGKLKRSKDDKNMLLLCAYLCRLFSIEDSPFEFRRDEWLSLFDADPDLASR